MLEALYFTGDEAGARKQFDRVRGGMVLADGFIGKSSMRRITVRISSKSCSKSAGRELCYESKQDRPDPFRKITEVIDDLGGRSQQCSRCIDLLKDNCGTIRYGCPFRNWDRFESQPQQMLYADNPNDDYEKSCFYWSLGLFGSCSARTTTLR